MATINRTTKLLRSLYPSVLTGSCLGKSFCIPSKYASSLCTYTLHIPTHTCMFIHCSVSCMRRGGWGEGRGSAFNSGNSAYHAIKTTGTLIVIKILGRLTLESIQLPMAVEDGRHFSYWLAKINVMKKSLLMCSVGRNLNLRKKPQPISKPLVNR